MRIIVTGGTGRVGAAAVERLLAHGHTVRVLGRRPEMQVPGAEYRSCDITNFEALNAELKGIEGIVHLAAIRNPGLGSGPEIFDANCLGTFNVFEAAARQGIQRVVTASSINALGYFFGVADFALQYLPIDEAHPTYTTDPYSFSKQIVEEIAAYYWRREGISSFCLRLPGVHVADADHIQTVEADRTARRTAFEAFFALPEAARQARVMEMMARFGQIRAQRYYEQPRDSIAPPGDPDLQMIAQRQNFWAWIDARDSAQAIEKALLSDCTGSHILFVNDTFNLAEVDARLLTRYFFPQVNVFRQPLAGHAALVSIERARALIGFEPEYHAAHL